MFVANTPADTVDVIDVATRQVIARIPVGIDPVSLAVRPDQQELWVSNHISDSVSVIDTNSDSSTFLRVIATVQAIDEATKSTRFDEPVGIAFASNAKAYIALSSENTIAVVDVATHEVVKRLKIAAQDPRAISVQGNRLYVIPFESNNQTQLSGGRKPFDGDLVTFDAWEHSVLHNNVLSLGHVVDIVKHPEVPDRDLFVFDTDTDELIDTVDSLGTLLYGMAVDSEGTVFIAQTDARNDANGRSGTKKHGLAELENRAFLNRITRVQFASNEAQPSFFDLEPLPPLHPKPEDALATPFAIAVSPDDQVLVASAAASDKVFTLDAHNGDVLGSVDVGAVPRGIALENEADGSLSQAWVYNAVSNSVSLVDLRDTSNPSVVSTLDLFDPTHPTVKRGRMAFESASASTTATFSCASCHPDGHTDQLLWVLKTPIVSGGDQIMPRSTMPIRGLRDTAPFHWDGVPGDPYGGNNSASIHGSVPPNSDAHDPTSSTRHLIDGGIAGTMSLVGDKQMNDEGKAGALTSAQRDDMATFLLSVPYPPSQRRAYTNVVSQRALDGFKLFHIDGDHDEKLRPNVCGNCHRMPFLVSTNTPGTGMDAPTWRGAYDRFLILPQGRLNIIEFDFYRRVAEQGQDERSIWQFSWAGRSRFDPVWEMVLEGSTGFSGSFARQVTLNQNTVNDPVSIDLLNALELASREQAVVLDGQAVLIGKDSPQPISLSYDGTHYVSRQKPNMVFSRDELIEGAAQGKFVGTFTARHGVRADVEHPQPALWTRGPIEQQRGRQQFPILYQGSHRMVISGRHIQPDANVIVDGRRVPATLQIEDEQLEIHFPTLPKEGMHLLQVQNTAGMFSNDFIFHVVADADAAVALQTEIDEPHIGLQGLVADAIADNDLARLERLIDRGADLNDRQTETGSTPLVTAALHGNLPIARYLIQQGADVDATNRDGNAPLHIAAFLCHTEVVKLLLQHGASTETRSNRGEQPMDVVSSPWNESLEDVYRFVGNLVDIEIDLQRMQQDRPMIAELLRDHQQATSTDR
ncbi:ankyrin repeat domain-containing protein [Roseimaritima ulvae]|uniref:ankyrin repeat domain-containing protein n=1 Tax=Roseimaritima ulvae TaxID=980254 RepID=UPI000836BF06|nr:ankyrin repeat domain-containing protein [Roseimaritima ulvae]